MARNNYQSGRARRGAGRRGNARLRRQWRNAIALSCRVAVTKSDDTTEIAARSRKGGKKTKKGADVLDEKKRNIILRVLYVVGRILIKIATAGKIDIAKEKNDKSKNA